MRMHTETRLTPRQRLTRGLTYSALGPVDITRGVVELGVHSGQSAASNLRQRYREGRLLRDLATAQEALAAELLAAQDVVTGLPQALQEARRTRRRSRRPWVIVAAAILTLAGGAVAFSIVRRSSRREPSPRPPSVDVQQQP